jgi:hypothetical protein
MKKKMSKDAAEEEWRAKKRGKEKLERQINGQVRRKIDRAFALLLSSRARKARKKER